MTGSCSRVRPFRPPACAQAAVVLLVVACGGGQDSTPTPTSSAAPVPVASVTVTPSAPTVIVGSSLQLVATTLDNAGHALSGRLITWTSSNSAVASVSASGLVTGVAAGGPVTITATSEGRNGTSLVSATVAVVTGISNAATFMDHCPTTDPAYATLRQDFQILVDGVADTVTVTCTEPFSAVPIAQLTDELIAWQTLRTAYYMSIGTQGKLPWTPLSFYAWLKANVAGINLRTAPGAGGDCCATINGKLYFEYARQDTATRNAMRDWPWISAKLAFFAHERRHADPGGYPHVTGCAAFPAATGVLGCDGTYDLNNLGAYGIQYWLESSWTTGFLNVGIGCASATIAQQYALWHAGNTASFSQRIVSGPPGAVQAAPPYGGPCVGP